MLDALMTLIPRKTRVRAGWKLLRGADPSLRAYSDIFVEPYPIWTDWRSGLGDSSFVLYSIVRAVKPRVIVETGTSRGKSTCAMALACKQNGGGHIHTIDPHTQNAWAHDGCEDSLTFINRRLREYQLQDRCTVHVGTSAEIAAT